MRLSAFVFYIVDKNAVWCADLLSECCATENSYFLFAVAIYIIGSHTLPYQPNKRGLILCSQQRMLLMIFPALSIVTPGD